MAKRYYWLKLKEDFFKQKEIKRLRRIAGGDTYTIIYLKLLLLSLRTEGKVFFEGVGDDFVDELSLEMDEDPENIQVTLSFLQNKGLLEIVSDSEYFMSDIPTMIGSETDAAIRKRRSRARKNQNQLEQKKDNKLRPSDKNVTLSQSSHTEIEIEKDIEKDSTTTADAIVFYQNNFGLAGPFESQGIMDWINDMGEEMVLEAMQRAIKRNKKSWGYAEGILIAWRKKNIRTIEQAKAEDVEFQNQRSGYYQGQQKKEVVPDWFKQQKEQRKRKVEQKQQENKPKTPEEIEQEKREFEEMLAEFRNGKE